MIKRHIKQAVLASAIIGVGVFSAVTGAMALVKVNTMSITAYTGFSIYVAKELGLFAKNGIDTEPKWYPRAFPRYYEPF